MTVVEIVRALAVHVSRHTINRARTFKAKVLEVLVVGFAILCAFVNPDSIGCDIAMSIRQLITCIIGAALSLRHASMPASATFA
jgi:hypothetical protein